MKIGIDAHYVGVRFGGNETLCEKLINALGDLAGTDTYEVYVNDVARACRRIKARVNVTLRRLQPHSVWIQRALTLPLLTHRNQIDVLHVPFIAPPLASARQIVAIHDLSFERFPEYFGRVDRVRMRTLVRYSARRADRIFTLSESARQDILTFYHVPAAKVRVVPAGVDLRVFRKIDDTRQLAGVRQRYQLPDHFVLVVGTIQPRKNLPRLIAAFDQVIQQQGLPHHLVIAGRDGWLSGPTFAAARSARCSERIRFLGPVPDDDLPALYNLADALAFPSLFEGFGLPPLEAMASGTPVAAANTSSLPEVVGEAGLLFDPYHVDAIAAALTALLTDAALRTTLSERGLARCQQFTWHAAARCAQQAFHEVIQQ